MIKLSKIEGTDIFEFSITGGIDRQGVKDFYNLLEETSKQNLKIKLLGTVDHIPGFENLATFWETLKMKVKAISNIDKYAVLSDTRIIESMLPVGNVLTPGILIKHFDLEQREKAIAWLKKEDYKTVLEDDYLTRMNVTKIKGSNIYAFTIDGKIDTSGMTALYNILKDKTRDGKANFIVYFKHFNGFDSLMAFFEGLKVDYASFGNIDKFGIITDKKWIRNIAEIESKILPGITIKGYKEEDEFKALAWLKE